MQISPQIYGVFLLSKNKNELSKFDFLDLDNGEKKKEKCSLDYLDLSSFFYYKVNSDVVSCWNCQEEWKINEKLSGKVDFYGHMFNAKKRVNPYIQLVALHVICLPCNQDLLDNGIVSYIDECPFKCGSQEMRQRIVVHATGVILKKEPMSLTQINQIKTHQRLEYCLEILKILGYGIFGQVVSTGLSLVAIGIMLSPTVGLIMLIGKINELFQEKCTLT